jgi:hypothetical protein
MKEDRCQLRLSLRLTSLARFTVACSGEHGESNPRPFGPTRVARQDLNLPHTVPEPSLYPLSYWHFHRHRRDAVHGTRLGETLPKPGAPPADADQKTIHRFQHIACAMFLSFLRRNVRRSFNRVRRPLTPHPGLPSRNQSRNATLRIAWARDSVFMCTSCQTGSSIVA